MLPGDSPFLWKVNLKQLGWGSSKFKNTPTLQITSSKFSTTMNYLMPICILSSVTIEIPKNK